MKLNFKEHLTDFALDKARDYIDDSIGDDSNTDLSQDIPIIEELSEDFDYVHIEHTNDSSLLEAKDTSKELLSKLEAKNLFTLPSVITIGFFLLSLVYIDVDQALSDGVFTTRETFKVVYLLFGGVAQLVSRGSEGSTNVYTPHGLPGKNKEDYDGDGIINELDDTPWG